MGLRGPNPKSAALRILEGQRAHRPLPAARPASVYASGVPERPKGMSAAARRIWDGYVEQLAGSLRLVDGFALRRLCEDVAEMQDLQAGRRKLIVQMKAKAKREGKTLSGGAAISLAASQEGRRLAQAISQISSRVRWAELQFGLTPASACRVENSGGMPMSMASGVEHGIEEALCG